MLRVFKNGAEVDIGIEWDESLGIQEKCIMRHFISLLFAKDNWNDQVKEDEMGRALAC
jgi:hypothetical protein